MHGDLQVSSCASKHLRAPSSLGASAETAAPPQEGSEAHAHGLQPLGAMHAATPVLPEQGVPSAPAPRRQRAWRQMTRGAGAHDAAHPNLMTSAPALVSALETMEEELAIRVIPEERSVMLLQVSKTMRTAMQRVSPPAMIQKKKGETFTRSIQGAILDMMKWCRITALDLSYTNINADGMGRLAAVLGQCASLAHLNLSGNKIGAEGAGRLAAVLGQCASLAHLNLEYASD